MNFEDDLMAMAQEKPRNEILPAPEQAAMNLIAEIRSLGIAASKALFDRRIPVHPISVRSSAPSSRIKHFFTGDEGNPMVRVGEGWDIFESLVLDTYGQLWEWNQGILAPVDFTWMIRSLAYQPTHFAMIGSSYLYLMHDDANGYWNEIMWTENGTGVHKDFRFSLREAFLIETARLIDNRP